MTPRTVWPAVVLTVAALLLTACGAKAPSTHNGTSGSTTKGTSKGTSAKPDTSILTGDILIADSYNSRLLLVSPQKKILWTYPSAGHPRSPYFQRPDDAFFTPGYRYIMTNQEDFGYVSMLDPKTGKLVWSFGQFGNQGRAMNQLHNPDDAMLLPNGDVVVADIFNQRLLWIDLKTKGIVRMLGHTRVRRHDPPSYFAAPNGAFPGPNGETLVTEIGGYVDLLDSQGNLLWSHQVTPWVPYPSDANFTPNGNIIVVSYQNPGAIAIFSPKGGPPIWYYRPTSGPGMLDQPSLAVMMTNGKILLNDDYNDRVIVIDPKTKQIIWQYGYTAQAGSAPGYLNIPDGLDILPYGQSFPGLSTTAQ